MPPLRKKKVKAIRWSLRKLSDVLQPNERPQTLAWFDTLEQGKDYVRDEYGGVARWDDSEINQSSRGFLSDTDPMPLNG